MRTMLVAAVLLGALGGGARAQEPTPAPKSVAATLKPGAVSLRWDTLPLGARGAPVGVHLFCIPPKGTRREDIGPGTTIKKSPFFASLWAEKSGRWTKLTEVRFSEDGDCSGVQSRWLDAKKTMPVLLLRFGVGDVGEWQSFTFPRGFGSAAVAQSFGFSENSGVGLDSRDPRGFWQVEDEWTDEKNRTWEAFWRWNGKKFVQTKPKRTK